MPNREVPEADEVRANLERFLIWVRSSEFKAAFRSWTKVFLAAVLSLAASGERDWKALLSAGICAILPVFYNWLDPKDPRYGRGYEAPTGDA
jgi:hypothetical protein